MTTARVTHSAPGRLRLRVDGTRVERHRALAALRDRCDGGVECSTDPRTGSALLTYDPDELDVTSLLELARTADSAFALLEPPSLRRLVDQPTSDAANWLLVRFRRANGSVLRATDGSLDLRMVFPAALGGLALRQLLRQGIGLRSAPWYVLAYYAFDSYVKLHDRDVNGARS